MDYDNDGKDEVVLIDTGTDLLRINQEIKSFDCPLTGRKLWALPPANPEA